MTRTPHNQFNAADVIYESFYTGGVGGSIVALTFLLLDGVAGHPFFTPSLLGKVLFAGASPASVSSVSLKAVAYYTPVHFAAFLMVGLLAAILARTMERRSPRPFWVMLVLFCFMEGGYLFTTHFFLHGVAAALDVPRVTGVNFLAAVGMVGFLHYARHVEVDMRSDAEPASSMAG